MSCPGGMFSTVVYTDGRRLFDITSCSGEVNKTRADRSRPEPVPKPEKEIIETMENDNAEQTEKQGLSIFEKELTIYEQILENRTTIRKLEDSLILPTPRPMHTMRTYYALLKAQHLLEKRAFE